MENRNAITVNSIIILLALVISSPQVRALSTGITGHSGNPSTNGGNSCALCHTGGIVPTAQLSGPASVAAGSVNTFTLSMSGGQQNLAGFNISTSQGALSASSQGIGTENGELKHTQPFNVGTGGGQWTFNYTAPAITGTVTIYAAVLSANGDSNTTGDNVATTTLTIEITPAQVLLPPTAIPGGPFFSTPGEIIQFDGSNSTNGDGNITRYLWDFGDGSAFGEGQVVDHSYVGEGTFAVTLAATDDNGLTGAAATTVTVTANAGAAQGEALFMQKCSGCHTFPSALAGRTVEQINTALATVAAMQVVSVTPEEIDLIAAYLATLTTEPPPRPTDGPGLYAAFCSLCHGTDGRGGSAKGVTGAPLQMIDDAIANVTPMQSIDLTLEERQLVADFLVQGGSGAIPTDGPGLYQVFCSVCHGPDGGGGPYQSITGASSPMITEAIANVRNMDAVITA